MSWQIKIASKGSGPESYTIRVPFFLSDVGEFPEADKLTVEQSIPLSLGGRDAAIKRKEHYYILTVPDFCSEPEAVEFLHKINAGLLLLILKYRIGIHFQPNSVLIETEHNKEIRDSFAPELYRGWEQRADGTYTDGGVWPMHTVIIPEHKRIIEYGIGWAKIVNRLNIEQIAEMFRAATENYDAEKIFENERLKLAFDMFSSAYAQRNRQITFLNLVTTLEILSDSQKASSLVRATIDGLQKSVKEARHKYSARIIDEEKDGYNALNELLEGLGRLKKRSITESVCELVYSSLYLTDESVSREASDKIVREIYGVRSDLVHTGKINHRGGKSPNQRFSCITQLEVIVPKVLLFEMNKDLTSDGQSIRPMYL
jgi:hypothetical protein